MQRLGKAHLQGSAFCKQLFRKHTVVCCCLETSFVAHEPEGEEDEEPML